VPRIEHRIILDTNIVVRGFINSYSESGRILRACERRVVVPVLSRPVLAEYRAVLSDPELIGRYPELGRPEIKLALERLVYVADVVKKVSQRFDYPRDPDDAMLIELALAGDATHLITTDRDLLTLPKARNEAAKRFRQRLPCVSVAPPEQYLRAHPSIFEWIDA
jgi:putative PIN family toxin of toxin-antitoxin system